MNKTIHTILFTMVPFAFVLTAQAAPAKIKEIKEFKQVAVHVKDKNTMLLLSIDNTLLKSPMLMGQRSWYYHRQTLHTKNGLKEPQATQKALAEWTGVLNLFGQQAVAPDIAVTIDQLQKKQIKIMGISSRGLGLASLTVQHLAEAGIDLGRTSGLKQDMPVIMGEKLLLLRNGILFTSGVGKAIALKKLYDLTKISKPKRVVMVSHDENALKMVAEGMKQHAKEVEFVPLRYTVMDLETKQFNAQAADAQFESLKNVLSNEQAKVKVSGVQTI